MIYLDHNSTTPLRSEVRDAMMPYLSNEYGNASSIHQAGQRVRAAIEKARLNMAEFIGADDENEIIFTSGGTESNNLAIKGVLDAHSKKGKRIISSAIEHSAVRHVLQHLTERGHVDNVVIPVEPNGIVGPQNIEDAITADTILVSTMVANNETGTIQPVSDIAELCRQKNVLFHTDAVQAAGKLPIRVNELGVDLLSLSAHKFGGPKGIGILYVKKGTEMASLIQGGSQEKNRRGGTENSAAIIGMGMAAQWAQKELGVEPQRQAELRNKLESGLLSKIPKTFVNGDLDQRVSNTTNICFEYTDSSGSVMSLDIKGISCSNGSACASGSADPSHVLLAMGLPQDKAHASLRFSLGRTTTEDDIEESLKIIPQVIAGVREAHPLWKEAVNQ